MNFFEKTIADFSGHQCGDRYFVESVSDVLCKLSYHSKSRFVIFLAADEWNRQMRIPIKHLPLDLHKVQELKLGAIHGSDLTLNWSTMLLLLMLVLGDLSAEQVAVILQTFS